MEGKNQHFSHSHNLNLHKIPDGTAITCSGCNSSATATVYACLQCNFFLHEQCYRASRSFKHPSHPAHPLTLVPYPTYPSNSFYCDSCNQIGTGLSYTCANCEFDLHVQCAYNISKSTLLSPPNHIDHRQHLPLPTHTQSFSPHHAFPNQCLKHETLPSFNAQNSLMPHQTVTAPSNDSSMNYPPSNQPPSFNHQIAYMPNDQAPTLIPNSSPNQETTPCSVSCSGCKDIRGSSCNFHLDMSRYGFAQEIQHKSHPQHPLTLHSFTSDEHDIFICSACFTDCVSFTYNCASCKFNLHVMCASLPETVKRNDHEHTLNLAYSCPIATDEGYAFFCDVCGEVVEENYWTYCCGKCNYGEVCEGKESSSLTENPILDSQMQILQAQMQLQSLQLQMEGGRQRAQLMMQMGKSSFTGI